MSVTFVQLDAGRKNTDPKFYKVGADKYYEDYFTKEQMATVPNMNSAPCPSCEKFLKPIVIECKPERSEFYCTHEHLSFLIGPKPVELTLA